MSNKRFSFEECIWYFQHLKTIFRIGDSVKYRNIGNGHYPELWGYDRYRRGQIMEFIKVDNPLYLFKVKISDLDNKQLLTVHPDLIERLDKDTKVA
tara:strand:- start:245 stop:532 length:288 start_codon:yes stop_codon:yes gene_type:complete